VDVVHEAAVANRVSSTMDGDDALLPALLKEPTANLPAPPEPSANFVGICRPI